MGVEAGRADTLIELPLTLDFCSQKPDVEPLTSDLAGTSASLFFPPSLSDGKRRSLSSSSSPGSSLQSATTTVS